MKSKSAIRVQARFGGILYLLAVATLYAVSAPPVMAAPDAPPCAANPESRQLDFWLGDWTVTYPGITSAATSTVHLSLDQCLLIEHWDGGKGHNGENMFAYSADDKSWHGMFADNQGRVHVFEGKVSPGSAEFYGPSRGPNGEAVLNRIRIIRLAKDKVEQSWEKSTDNGATWTTNFRGEYSRRNP